MKLRIKTNGTFNKAKIIKENGKIDAIEFDFDKVYAWSDLECWLTNDNDIFCDYMAINVSKRNKLQTHK